MKFGYNIIEKQFENVQEIKKKVAELEASQSKPYNVQVVRSNQQI